MEINKYKSVYLFIYLFKVIVILNKEINIFIFVFIKNKTELKGGNYQKGVLVIGG